MLEKWIVSWTDRDPVTLSLDLKKAYNLDRMRILYSGCLSVLTVEGSPDRQSWQAIGTYPAQFATVDVPDVTVLLSGTYRYVRLRFGERAAGVPMELAEIELWGRTGL